MAALKHLRIIGPITAVAGVAAVTLFGDVHSVRSCISCNSSDTCSYQKWEGKSIAIPCAEQFGLLAIEVTPLVKLETSGIFGLASSLFTGQFGPSYSRKEEEHHGFDREKHDAAPQTLLSSTESAQPLCADARNFSCEKASVLAQEYAQELTELGVILGEREVELPQPRFSAAELFRFADTLGIREASSDAERHRILSRTADRISETISWHRGQVLLNERDLTPWSQLLYWEDTKAEEVPLLVIKLGKATQECRGKKLDEFAVAVISQVDNAVAHKFSDDPTQPDQMTAVVDCSGATTLQASHVLRLIKDVSLALNRYYPRRLHKFYLVDVPRVIRWPVKAIIGMGHPSTRGKVVVCNQNDPRLPGNVQHEQ